MYDVRGVANWFLDKAAECQIRLSNMALNKLIYFAVERGILEKDIVITNAKIEAWEHGPVFREIYHAFKSFDAGPITSRATRFDSRTRSMVQAHEEFSSDVEGLLNATFDSYGSLSASQLRAISHQPGSAWDAVWWHEGKVNPGMEITKENIEQSLQRSVATNG